MDKQEFINFLQTGSAHKLIKDTYGNYKGEKKDGTVIRYKIQPNSVRFERQLNLRDKNEWRKVWSEYYSNLEINPESGHLRRIKKGN